MSYRLAVCLALAATVACHGDALGPNLVQNASFEELDDSGWAVAWGDQRPVFTVSEKFARTGERCLKWENDDPERYVLCGQSVQLERGYRYEFEVWVRTEDLGGEGSGATVCMEWWDEDGEHMGGSYPQGVKGDTREWTRVRGTTRPIPERAAEVNLVVYVRKGGVGTAWFDDCSVRRYRPPLLGAITTGLYRGITTGGAVRVHVGMTPRDWDYEPDEIQAQLRVTDEDGSTVLTAAPHERTQNALRFRLQSGPLAPGDYELTVTARTPDGETEEVATAALRRIDRAPDYRCWIDEHQRLIVDGEPFFPLGTYWNRISGHSTSLIEEHLDIYADSAFNCLMPYDSWNIDEAQLDACHERGISVIFSVKDFYVGHFGLETEEDAREHIAEYVERFGDHPAIIAWYIDDESPASMYDRLRAHQLWMEQLDPGRPTWAVHYRLDDLPRLLGTFDVIGTDPYPIPTVPPGRALLYTRRTVDATLGLKPIWMVPQIFNYAYIRGRAGDRAPTLEEMRSMAWQCIAGGANGLVFYAWHSLWRAEEAGFETFESRWPDVRRMAAEIRRFEPMLLSVKPAVEPATVQAPEEFGWRVYGMDGRTHLLAVNADREPVEATFTFPHPIADHEVLFRDPDVRVDGGTLRLHLGGLEPTIIALEPARGEQAWRSWRERTRR